MLCIKRPSFLHRAEISRQNIFINLVPGANTADEKPPPPPPKTIGKPPKPPAPLPSDDPLPVQERVQVLRRGEDDNSVSTLLRLGEDDNSVSTLLRRGEDDNLVNTLFSSHVVFTQNRQRKFINTSKIFLALNIATLLLLLIILALLKTQSS